MDVQESLGIRRPAQSEIPAFALRLEPGRGRRIPLALAGAVAFHLLLLLSIGRLGELRLVLPATTPSAPRAMPTPVTVFFYEQPREPPAKPAPGTEERSDRDSRARSEIAPTPAPSRLPAALGDSPEREPRSGSEPPRKRPPPEPPRAPSATTAAATLETAAASPSEEPPRPISPSLAAAEPQAAGRSPFGEGSLDAAIRSQGFANAASAVTETGPMAFDALDFEWGPYARRIYRIVDRNWKSVIPLAARMPGVSGKVMVGFRILRSGRIEDIRVVESSGRKALDQAALASLELSNPLPPLPEEFERDEVGVTFSYYYNLPLE